MHHLYALKISETPSLQTPKATSNPQKSMEFNIHGLHQEVTHVRWLWHDIGQCWLPHQAVNIYPNCDTITSPMLAKLFVLHVFSKHGVPSHVTSDRGSEFVSAFFHSLRKVLDMKLHFTPSYHPEGNRQTEHANQTLEQYFQVYCNY